MQFNGKISHPELEWKNRQPIISFDWHDPSFNVDPSIIARYRADYQAALRDADRATGEILRSFQAAGLLKNTIIILTSDHGEEFREHDSIDHCASLYEEIVRIPVLIKGPYLKGRIRNIPGLLSDLGSTLLDLVNIPVSFGSGNNLLRCNNLHRIILLDSRRHGYVIGGVIVDQFKYLAPFEPRKTQPVLDHYYPRPWKEVQVYDLTNDPQEKHPVHIAPDHQEQLHKIWSQIMINVQTNPWKTDELDTQTFRALQELGYIQ
ncbi:sulfatase-like hydrolase/transferase [bacterium]|nr:sulfatase-like hydrolase/transferase [bacterium]